MKSKEIIVLQVVYISLVMMAALLISRILWLVDTSTYLGLGLISLWVLFIFLVFLIFRVTKIDQSENWSGFAMVKKVFEYSVPLQFLVLMDLIILGYSTVTGVSIIGTHGKLALDQRLFEGTLFTVQFASLIPAFILAYSIPIGLLDRVRTPESKNALGPFLFMLGAIIFAIVGFTPYYYVEANKEWLRENLGGIKLFWVHYAIYSVLSFYAVLWFQRNISIQRISRKIGRQL